MMSSNYPCPDKPEATDTLIMVVTDDLKVVDSALCYGTPYYAGGAWQPSPLGGIILYRLLVSFYIGAKIHENQGIIHKACRLYCCNPEDCKDMFQEILLKLWKGYPSFRGDSKPTTWMYRVAINTAITFHRKRQIPYDRNIDTESLHIVDDSESGTLEEDILLLYKAIGRLNKVDRAITWLYPENNSYEEIGNIIGITVSHVGVKIVRIKEKLEKIMIS